MTQSEFAQTCRWVCIAIAVLALVVGCYPAFVTGDLNPFVLAAGIVVAGLFVAIGEALHCLFVGD